MLFKRGRNSVKEWYMNKTKELEYFFLFAIKTVSVYVFLPLSFYILLFSFLVSIFPLL